MSELSEQKRPKVVVIMPAYNAAKTLRMTYMALPHDVVDVVLLVDDGSSDETVEIARELNLELFIHNRNYGYGGNQKTCYAEALKRGAGYVIMLHADYQYDGRMIGPAVHVLKLGICDVVLGNRIRTRREALEGGMPPVKYLSNRGLTLMENLLSGQNLGEWHSGFRAYSRRVLEAVPFKENSDNFVFDSQFLVQSVHFGFKIGDVPVPVRYFDEASSISIRASTRYAFHTLATFAQWYGHRLGVLNTPRFRRGTPAAQPAS
jgi:glycosyltransferase involved in cell wall biosynthesis